MFHGFWFTNLFTITLCRKCPSKFCVVTVVKLSRYLKLKRIPNGFVRFAMKSKAWSKSLEGILVIHYFLKIAVTILTTYRGSGVECRKLVQELNMKKAGLDQYYERIDNDTEAEVISNVQDKEKNVFFQNCQTQNANSKWSKYL